MAGIKEIRGILLKRMQEIENALVIIQKMRLEEPDGILRLGKSNGNTQYYHITETGDTRGKYIRKEEMDFIKSLAQKKYYHNLEKILRTEQEKILGLLKIYNDSPETVFDKLSEERKQLVTPLFVSDEVYASTWMSETYETNPYFPEELIYETNRGEKVRSKSEMMIANLYNQLKIPYRYESKLVLKNNVIRYPDFVVLDTPKRRVVIHEHLGLMDNAEYREENLKKIYQYNESGIVLGKNLIVTFEGQNAPLNLKVIKNQLEQIFCK